MSPSTICSPAAFLLSGWCFNTIALSVEKQQRMWPKWLIITKKRNRFIRSGGGNILTGSFYLFLCGLVPQVWEPKDSIVILILTNKWQDKEVKCLLYLLSIYGCSQKWNSIQCKLFLGLMSTRVSSSETKNTLKKFEITIHSAHFVKTKHILNVKLIWGFSKKNNVGIFQTL